MPASVVTIMPIANRCAASSMSMSCWATTFCIVTLNWLTLLPFQKYAMSV